MRDSVEIPAGLASGVRWNPGRIAGGARELTAKEIQRRQCDRILKPVGAIVTLTAIGGIVGFLGPGGLAMCAGAGAFCGIVLAGVICIAGR